MVQVPLTEIQERIEAITKLGVGPDYRTEWRLEDLQRIQNALDAYAVATMRFWALLQPDSKRLALAKKHPVLTHAVAQAIESLVYCATDGWVVGRSGTCPACGGKVF